MRLQVLVTGANSGIGLASAIALARRGYAVTGTVRSEEKAATLHEAAAAAEVSVSSAILDVNDAARCEELFDRLALYGLVNNAGYGLTGAIEDVAEDDARHLFDTMVFAPMRLARLALPAMREAGEGRIVNISSMYGVSTTPLTGWYQGAKHALEGLSDALRMEVAGGGIFVSLVEPGGVKTSIWDDATDKPPVDGSRFDASYERMAQLIGFAQPFMTSAEGCAAAVVAAIDARWPRSRYLVGLDARVAALSARVTPTPILDRILRLAQGL